jgi:hypothetical protein
LGFFPIISSLIVELILMLDTRLLQGPSAGKSNIALFRIMRHKSVLTSAPHDRRPSQENYCRLCVPCLLHLLSTFTDFDLQVISVMSSWQ